MLRVATALTLLLAGCATSASPRPGTAGLGQKAALGSLRVTPLRVEEDSRCPSGVTCIQAGTVRLLVRIDRDGARRQAILRLAEPHRLGAGDWLVLCTASPHPSRPGPIAPSAYRFGFARAPACP